jgi:tellurium resistance protein TerD
MPTLTLTKVGQTASLLNLAKDAGNANLNAVSFGIGWDKQGDNDASILFLDASKNVVGAVFPPTFTAPLTSAGHLASYKNANCGDFVHSGDDRTGESSNGGDDETITGTLNSLPVSVQYVSIVVNNYDSKPLAQFGELYARVVDKATEAELVRVKVAELSNAGTVGLVIATLHRKNGAWELVSTPVCSLDADTNNFTGMDKEALQAIALIPAVAV